MKKRAGSGSHHTRTIATLPHIGKLRTQVDADELIIFTREFLDDLLLWMGARYPELG